MSERNIVSKCPWMGECSCNYGSNFVVVEVIEKLMPMTLNNGRGWELLLTVFMRVCQICGS